MSIFDMQRRPAISHGKHPGGAPGYKLTDDQRALIVKWASSGISQRMVADWLRVSEDMFQDPNNELSVCYKNHYRQACHRVAARQFELLEQNSNQAVTMAIWLGKQHLGQRDVYDTHTSGEVVFRVVVDTRPMEQLPGPEVDDGQVIDGEVVEQLEAPQDTDTRESIGEP